MDGKIQKWGNSLAIRIPKAFAEEVGFAENTEVDIALSDEAVVIKPKKNPIYKLAELIAKIETENLHSEIDTGPELGVEVI